MHSRWICNNCKREWVFALQVTSGCPVCGPQAEAILLQYQPSFPGADIPREQFTNILPLNS